jgi:hypothetical protein
MRWIRAIESLGPLVDTIERTIARSSIRSLEDAELLVALESAKKTFESEEKGVIFEDLPEGPTLQALTRDLVGSVRSFLALIEEERKKLKPGGPALPSIGPSEIVECLGVLAERCEYHIRRREEAGTLVGHLRRVHPPRLGEDPAGGARVVLT